MKHNGQTDQQSHWVDHVEIIQPQELDHALWSPADAHYTVGNTLMPTRCLHTVVTMMMWCGHPTTATAQNEQLAANQHQVTFNLKKHADNYENQYSM